MVAKVGIDIVPKEYWKCPTCLSDLVGFEVRSKHCNGEWNVYYKYECGCVKHYSPNFRKLVIDSGCPNDPELLAKKKKLLGELKKLSDFAEKLDIDNPETKDLLLSHLKQFSLRERLPYII